MQLLSTKLVYSYITAVRSQTGPKRSGPNFLRPERFSIPPIPAPTLPAPVQKCNHINLSQNCNRLQPFRPQSKMHQYRPQSHTFYYFRDLRKRGELFFKFFSFNYSLMMAVRHQYPMKYVPRAIEPNWLGQVRLGYVRLQKIVSRVIPHGNVQNLWRSSRRF